MKALKEFSGKEIYDLDDMDVWTSQCTKISMILAEPLYTTMLAQMWETHQLRHALTLLNAPLGIQPIQ